ncbi:9743_t:CDS:2 [Paraglomus occultum]|uniref:9743_t:CDS:1 n=1 Tax=Paraglomus occultum TaxID=144539 RepID=A0A9N8ZK23_9GLOM|nr:9743_t:CDS:2 [Paraglomus occultum]
MALNDTTDLDLTNEATSSPYVRSFLVAAIRCFKEDIVLRPQKKLRGRHGHGPVDFALESHHAGATVCVTEVTKDDLKQGIAQNVVQLEACLNEVDEDTVGLEEAYGDHYGC